jgi:integrase
MASLHQQTNTAGTTWRVKWRQDGKQTSASFNDKAMAERFKGDVEQYGPEEAIRVLAVLEAEASVPTVTEYLTQFIDGLTGVQAATANKYRAYLARDITPVFGSLPIVAVTEHTIGAWVTTMASKKEKASDGIMKPPSRKTLQNKHAFLSGALKQAVKDGLIPANPCEGRRLPETQPAEKVFLTPAEFALLHSHITHPRWKNLAAFLVLTGMRFSEATALTPADIDPVKKTCRINKAWKYSGNYRPELGPPKTRKGNRIISLPDAALAVLDLTQPEWLFTNGAGNPVRSQEFFNLAWKPARDKAMKDGLRKCPRVHDLRHTCVSWLIEARVPLPVIQNRLGHESIKTTVDVYGGLDQRSDQAAAMALDDAVMLSPLPVDLSVERQ